MDEPLLNVKYSNIYSSFQKNRRKFHLIVVMVQQRRTRQTKKLNSKRQYFLRVYQNWTLPYSGQAEA